MNSGLDAQKWRCGLFAASQILEFSKTCIFVHFYFIFSNTIQIQIILFSIKHNHMFIAYISNTVQ